MTEEKYLKLATFFQILADSTRLKILNYLIKNKKSNVSDISKNLNLSQSTISHQLKLLRLNDICKTTREGKNIFYELSDFHIDEILNIGITHINEK